MDIVCFTGLLYKKSINQSNLTFVKRHLNKVLRGTAYEYNWCCWNSLPDYLKSSDLSFNCFRQQLKHFYFVNIDTSPSTTLAHQRHCWCALQIHDTYLLTYKASTKSLGANYQKKTFLTNVSVLKIRWQHIPSLRCNDTESAWTIQPLISMLTYTAQRDCSPLPSNSVSSSISS